MCCEVIDRNVDILVVEELLDLVVGQVEVERVGAVEVVVVGGAVLLVAIERKMQSERNCTYLKPL